MNEINDNKKAMSEDVKQALIRFNKDNIYVQNLKIELVDMSLGYVKGKMMVTEDESIWFCAWWMPVLTCGYSERDRSMYLRKVFFNYRWNHDIYSSGYEHGVSHL